MKPVSNWNLIYSVSIFIIIKFEEGRTQSFLSDSMDYFFQVLFKYNAQHVHSALMEKNWSKVYEMIKSNPELLREKYHGMTSLYWIVSCASHELFIVNILKYAKPEDVDTVSSIMGADDVCSVFHRLVGRRGKFSNALISLLDISKKRVNFSDRDGNTPLHDCLKYERDFTSHREIVQILLKAGADVSIENKHGQTPIDMYKENICEQYDKESREKQKHEILQLLRRYDKSGRQMQGMVCGGPSQIPLQWMSGGPSQVVSQVPPCQLQGQSIGLTVESFHQLLVEISSWWRRHGSISLLKVILCEFIGSGNISLTNIEENNDPYELIQLLRGPGIISLSNNDVLFEIVKLGQMTGVEHQEIFKKVLPNFPGFNQVEIRKFSNGRIGIINFGRRLGNDNITKIRHLYDHLMQDRVVDPWVLIFQLEKGGMFKGDKKLSFIQKLIDNGMEEQAILLL